MKNPKTRAWIEELTLITIAFYPWYGRAAEIVFGRRSYWFDLLYFACVFAVVDYRRIKWDKVSRFAPFLLIFLWSAALNVVPWVILKESLRRVIFPFGVMLFASAVDWDYDKLRRLMIYITVSGLLMGLVAGYQFVFKMAPQSEWLDTELDTDKTIIRVWSIFSIPTYYSLFLDLSVLTALGLLITAQRWWERALWAASFVAFLGAQVLTYARGGLLATAFGIFVTLAVENLLVAAGLAGAAVLSAFFVPALRDRFMTAFSWAYVQESSQPGGRLYQWGRALENVGILGGFKGLKRLLIGSGPGTFGTQASISLGLNGWLRIDGMYFALLAEYGVLGVVSFVYFIVSTLLEGLRNVLSRGNRHEQLLLSAVLGAVAAWAFHGLSDNAFDYFYLLPWLFSYAAIL
ncbi:hypothetical protein HPY42_01070 [Coprothermobacteraceae bacterium]|nr:hypothetical protein [Coprothermobacteraceae bacterium]